MAKYDPAIIRTYANALYFRAGLITLFCSITGLVVGFIVARALLILINLYHLINLEQFNDQDGAIFVISVTLIISAIGLAIGFLWSFALKLRAQTALCLVAIEENTRRR